MDTYKHTYKDMRIETMESATHRGHKMTEFEFDPLEELWSSYCKVCGREMYVIKNPAPNEIQEGGSAVAVCCDTE
jgi:hypothetical protein